MSGADADSKAGERLFPPYAAAAGLALVMWACAVAWAVRAGWAVREEGAPGSERALAELPAARIDVNSAEEAVLEALPGIGRTLARRIVTERERRGPFAGPDDLLRVRGVTRELIERIGAFVEFGEGAEREARP